MRRTRCNQELLETLRSAPHTVELADGREFLIISAYHRSGLFVVLTEGGKYYHQQITTEKGDSIPSVTIHPTEVC